MNETAAFWSSPTTFQPGQGRSQTFGCRDVENTVKSYLIREYLISGLLVVEIHLLVQGRNLNFFDHREPRPVPPVLCPNITWPTHGGYSFAPCLV